MTCQAPSLVQRQFALHEQRKLHISGNELVYQGFINECLVNTGKQPFSTRWIDISKGDAKCPNYRSRLVAREINNHKRVDLSAATQPLEAREVILSMAACCNKGETIMINDISRAFFHVKAKREVFVQIPQEDLQPDETEICGRLNYSMYGTRGADQTWFEEYNNGLLAVGFKQGNQPVYLLPWGERSPHVCTWR